MKKSSFIYIYIFPIMILSPFFMMSSNSWFSIWMIMELNLMSFIPFIIFFNKYYKELSIKYFIIQAISSSILIFSSNLMFINNNNIKLIMMIFINFSLFIKIGTPPFQNWFINMMNNMNWMNCLILSTWQKIIPMISLMYLYNKYMILIMTLLSSMTSAIFGINHQSIRLILSYSSINHLSWLFMNLMISEMIWIFYFFSYLMINSSIMMMLNKMNLFYMNQFFSLNLNFLNKLIILMNLFSISSLPPMFGFSLKWITIFYMNLNFIQMLLMLMILSSIFSFFYYTRLSINFMINFKLSNKMILINKFLNFKYYFYMIIFSSFMNLWIMSIWMI